MAKKRRTRPIKYDKIGADLAKMLAVKRRLIETCTESGDEEYARRVIEDIGRFLQELRKDLEEQLREGRLEDMSPENAQAAIYGIQIFEGSLRADYPELPH
jgi:hypothetical protein